MTIHEKLAIEFHERKLQYLKEEHEVKMKILHLELSMKERDMKQQQCQLSLEQNQLNKKFPEFFFYLSMPIIYVSLKAHL